MPFIRIVFKDETVVLVRVEKHFSAATASHDQKAVSDVGRVADLGNLLFKANFKNALDDTMVDIGDDFHCLGRTSCFRKQASGNLDNLPPDLGQTLQAFSLAYCSEQQHCLLAAVAHQVVDFDHADRFALVDNRQMLDAVAKHVGHRLKHVGLGRKMVGVRGHDLLRRNGRGVNVCGCYDLVDDIVFGDDSVNAIVGVADKNRCRLLGNHCLSYVLG